MNEFEEPLKVAPQQRPTITIPSNSSSSSFADSSLLCEASPGAMIYVPNFLGDNSAEQGDYPSFSDLLSGAIATPEGVLGYRKRESGDGDGGSGFKRNKPENLVLPMNISSAFAVSPGFSPSAFLNSPTFFSSSLNPYSLSCQQALAQVPPAAMLSRPHLGVQTEFYSPASALNPLSPSMAFQSSAFITPSSQPTCSNARQPNIRPQNLPAAVDKPANDGYNWRKYGQKQVKGSEYPRSYYKCTTPNCPVKKKVERSFVGHITEIIYKGQHNHAPPQNGRRGRDGTGSLADLGSEDQVGNFQLSGRLGRDSDSTQATSIQLQGPSDSEESGENYQQMEDDEDYYDEDDEPNVKKRNAGSGTCDIHFTHKTMTEPKIVVQTRSEVDLLDDGYRWRKYGQKVVKGNPNPRSYYKCTTVGCKVRKHVERASTDPQAVITTYEGKHNHDLPAARGNAMINSSNMDQQQTMLHNSVAQMNFGSKDQMSISLRLKEEQIVV